MSDELIVKIALKFSYIKIKVFLILIEAHVCECQRISKLKITGNTIQNGTDIFCEYHRMAFFVFFPFE